MTHEVRDRRPIVCACGGHAFVHLTQAAVALIDVEDAARVAESKWCLKGRRRHERYAVSVRDGKREHMHRLIACDRPGLLVDHANGDTLDNRKSNLRHCNTRQNRANTRRWVGKKSRFKGTQLHRGKWRARIEIGGKVRCFGPFDTEEEAAGAYNEAALRLHGEFARIPPHPIPALAGHEARSTGRLRQPPLPGLAVLGRQCLRALPVLFRE